MSSRRAPLADVPNATNSPYRAASTAASKRSRSCLAGQEELGYGQPPCKKQAIEPHHPSVRTPPRRQIPEHAEGQVFSKKAIKGQVTAFERKLIAAKDKQTQEQTTRQDKGSSENLDEIRQWQKHYRKAFPDFVFYFESVSDDIRIKCAKQVIGLGAREEKFFSKAVTHVVTTRSLPTDSHTSDSTDASAAFLNSAELATINPSVLGRSSELISQAPTLAPISRSKFILEQTSSRRHQFTANQNRDIRRQASSNVDILHRAKEMGMKTWHLEKLQRVLKTMFDTDTGALVQYRSGTRDNCITTNGARKANREIELSHMLKNEELHGPSDRDSGVILEELVPFKGYYLYVHDMNEKTRPVIVRDYPKVVRRADGDWPQFRSVSQGKCPFIEPTEKERIREMEVTTKAEAENEENLDDENSLSLLIDAARYPAKMHPPGPYVKCRQPLANASQSITKMTQAGHDSLVGQCDPSVTIAAGIRSPSKYPKNGSAIVGPKLHGGEPIASGVQPSNITSAIRSQMISSTAAAPGAKAGISREVHGLQRKVLEKNTGPAINGIPKSRRMTDLAGSVRSVQGNIASRQFTRGAQEKLGFIHEDFTPSEDEEDTRRLEALRVLNKKPKEKQEKKDPKPGYCENCKDKFDDFDSHTVGRKHRKFATTQENWKELDSLLDLLARPVKAEASLNR